MKPCHAKEPKKKKKQEKQDVNKNYLKYIKHNRKTVGLFSRSCRPFVHRWVRLFSIRARFHSFIFLLPVEYLWKIYNCNEWIRIISSLRFCVCICAFLPSLHPFQLIVLWQHSYFLMKFSFFRSFSLFLSVSFTLFSLHFELTYPKVNDFFPSVPLSRVGITLYARTQRR